MLDEFKREIALPRRYIISSWKEMKNIIDKNNGKTNIFTSLFKFEKTAQKEKHGRKFELGIYETAVIDKLFFDLDKKDCYNKVLKFHQYLKKLDIMHCMNFSGGGFHLFIFTTQTKQLKYKKDAYYNIQKFFAEHNGLTIGRPDKADLDSSVIGDLAQIVRIPNTFNLKRNRYCIPLGEEDLHLGYETIKEKAKIQQYPKKRILGRKKVDLKYFDYPKFGSEDYDETPKVEMPKIKVDTVYGEEHFYPCVYKMIKEGGYQNTFFVAIWLREKSYTEQEADVIFKKYLGGKHRRSAGYGDDYSHLKLHDKPLESVYQDKVQNYKFPTCEYLFQLQICEGKCKHHNDIYFGRSKK